MLDNKQNKSQLIQTLHKIQKILNNIPAPLDICNRHLPKTALKILPSAP